MPIAPSVPPYTTADLPPLPPQSSHRNNGRMKWIPPNRRNTPLIRTIYPPFPRSSSHRPIPSLCIQTLLLAPNRTRNPPNLNFDPIMRPRRNVPRSRTRSTPIRTSNNQLMNRQFDPHPAPRLPILPIQADIDIAVTFLCALRQSERIVRLADVEMVDFVAGVKLHGGGVAVAYFYLLAEAHFVAEVGGAEEGGYACYGAVGEGGAVGWRGAIGGYSVIVEIDEGDRGWESESVSCGCEGEGQEGGEEGHACVGCGGRGGCARILRRWFQLGDVQIKMFSMTIGIACSTQHTTTRYSFAIV